MIAVIAGTNRPESNSMIVAETLKDLLLQMGEEVRLLDLADLPVDFVYNDMFGDRREEMERIGQDYIVQPDKLIFVIPEYNGSFPGVLKAFVDSMEQAWFKDKKAGLIGLSSGRAGSLRAMDQFTNVLHYLKAHVHYSKPKLSGFDRLIARSDRKISDANCLEVIRQYATAMVEF